MHSQSSLYSQDTPTIPVPSLGTILCAVDGSEQSQAALYTAAGLAQGRDSRLIILRVDSGVQGETDEATAARAELTDFVQAVFPAGLPSRDNTQFVLRPGPIAATILETAREHGADLLVMGSRGCGFLTRRLLGSATSEVLRHTTIPVAVVPPTRPEIVFLGDTRPVPNFGVILVPVDLESASERQVAMAGRLSAASEHRVLLLHVVRAADHDRPLQQMEALARSLPSDGGIRLLVREGSPAGEIGSVVRQENAGIVVLGRSATDPGQVALELLRRGTAVVVVVP